MWGRWYILSLRRLSFLKVCEKLAAPAIGCIWNPSVGLYCVYDIILGVADAGPRAEAIMRLRLERLVRPIP